MACLIFNQIFCSNVCDVHTCLKLYLKKQIISIQIEAARPATKGIFLDRSAISRIESQERYVMDYEVLAIAKCLKVPVEYLLGVK